MANKNIILNFPHPDAISTTIRYARIDNTVSPIYTTIPNVTGTSYIIQNVANGQYRIFFKPNYADGRNCVETMIETTACTGITSLSVTTSEDNFVISYTTASDIPYVSVTIQYPNGGFSTTQHINTGDDITIAEPASVYGTYFITMQPVCDADSGWIGQATAPVSVLITPPDNSLLTNNATGDLQPVSIATYDGGANLIFASALVADGGGTANFYIPDGLYTTIVLTYGNSTVATATLVTVSGTYNGVISPTGTITFTNISVSAGITITLG